MHMLHPYNLNENLKLRRTTADNSSTQRHTHIHIHVQHRRNHIHSNHDAHTMSCPYKALCSVKVQFEDGVMGAGGKGEGLGLCPETQ